MSAWALPHTLCSLHPQRNQHPLLPKQQQEAEPLLVLPCCFVSLWHTVPVSMSARTFPNWQWSLSSQSSCFQVPFFCERFIAAGRGAEKR